MNRFAVAVLLAAVHLPAFAVPFGNTKVGTSQTFAPCTEDAVITSMSLTVDASSRLLYSMGGSAVSLDNTDAYGVGFQAVLRNTANAQIASSQWHNVVVGLYLQAASASEILFDTNTNAPIQLAPGNYTLELHVQTTGTCGGAGSYVQSPTLTYVLLSSVLDRIFANGFSMVLPERNGVIA